MSVNAYAYCANNPNSYVDYNGFDITWTTVFDIISACIIIDSLFPEFRLNYISERTKNKFVPRKDSRKKAGQHKKSGFRERNVKHPNGEEHSKTPKGSRVPNGNGKHRISLKDDVIPVIGIVTAIIVVIILLIDDSTIVGVEDDYFIFPILGVVFS